MTIKSGYYIIDYIIESGAFFMRSNSVAVLDIRSSEICALVGERGVNNTFIIKSKYVCAYDGYAEEELIDVRNFTEAVCNAVKSTLSAMNGIKTFYVGVPGEFLKLRCLDKVLSFKSAKRISSADCSLLLDSCRPEKNEKWITVKSTCAYYVLSDKRKVIDPIGSVSDSLQGKCCFFECKTAFADCVLNAFKNFKEITSVNLIPSNYAEGMYLFEPDCRDECVVLFDMGYISSTYSVVCGNGLLYSESFSLGTGHIALYISSKLDVPFEVASTFLSQINLNAKEKLTSNEECVFEGQTYTFSTAELRDIIREGLDGMCETIEECRRNFVGRNIDSKPLFITGDEVKTIRGTADHISSRLEKTVEIIAPKVPYYDKPQFSSVLSLLDAALRDINK